MGEKKKKKKEKEFYFVSPEMIFIFPPKKIKRCNALGESHSPHPDSNSSGWEDYGYYIVTKPLHAPKLAHFAKGRDRASGAISSPFGRWFAGSVHVAEVSQVPPSSSFLLLLPSFPSPRSSLAGRGKAGSGRQGSRQGWGWRPARPRLQSSRSLIGLN